MPTKEDQERQVAEATARREIRRAEMRASKLGTLVPDSISNRLETMMSALVECKPFAPYSDVDNEGFVDICIEEAQEIVRFLTAIKKMHEGQEESS